MNYFISVTFLIVTNFAGLVITLICSPFALFKSEKVTNGGARLWAILLMWILKKICRLDYEVIGLENLPKEPFILACKHQSSWEGIALSEIFLHPVYIYKKELESLPFYGRHLKAMNGIGINRQGGASVIKSLIKQGKDRLASGRMIIIFPQGTRTPIGSVAADYPYQAGIAALYSSCNVKVVPAALNSGVFWPKSSIKKKPGTVTLKLLEPINPGLKKAEFMKKLEEAIETNSDELCQNAKVRDQ
jgi:1-acyl-sn-glycerol-3-phosphate acyltransferase